MEYIKSFKSSNYDIVKFAEFAPINIFLILFTFLSVYFIYALRKIKDNETFGIKFEVHCSFIVSFIGKIKILFIRIFVYIYLCNF